MLKLGSNCNGVRLLNSIRCFRHFPLYSISSISPQSNPNFETYLVEFLGFSNQQALSTSSKLVRYRQRRGAKKVSDFYTTENANSVVEFLKQVGLQHSHIQNIIVSMPKLLWSKVDKTLIPKSQAFMKLGFSESDFAELIKFSPCVLSMGFDSCIIPTMQILMDIMGSQDHAISVIKKSRCRWLGLAPKVLLPNVALLRNYGISIESIRKHLLWNVSFFLRKTEFFKAVLIRAEETLGIPRHSPQFLPGIALLINLNEKTIESKRNIYKSFGWTDSDIVILSVSNPNVLGSSEASIRKKLNYLMNVVGYEPSFLAKRCYLFTYSLEKRIIPRHKVLLVLKENGLVKMDLCLTISVRLSESQFLKRFVIPFKEVHEVYPQIAGIISEKLTLGSSKPNSCAP